MKKQELCSIIILSYNQLDYTRQCLDSIRKYTDYPYEIIVVDNASNQETVDFLDTQKDIILVKNNHNAGFAGGCNQGIKLAKGNYIMLLNNDTIVTRGWLSNMVELLENESDIGMVGPLTNSTVGKQMIPVPYGDDMDEMHKFAEKLTSENKNPWRTLRLVAFCVLIRKSLINKIGLLDEAFQIGNYEDDDFNIRALLAGTKLYICRTSFIHHFMNVSFKKNNLPREQIMHKNKLLLENKWDKMDWNHHAVYNSWMLQKIFEHKGKDILHIGCGLGALAIELKDNNPDYHIVGIEDHPIRRNIAENFTDEIYGWDKDLEFLQKIENSKFDAVVIECMIEKSGIELIDKIKKVIKIDTQIFIRVFNISHISTIERLLTGEVEGNLLCASSKEFSNYFDNSIKLLFEEHGYRIIEIVDIKKSLSILQEEIINKLDQFEEFQTEGRVYNRIYQLELNNYNT